MLKKSLLNGCNNMSQSIQLITTTTTTTNTTKPVIINSHLKPQAQAAKKPRAPDASEAFFKSRRSCKWARFFFFLFYSENSVHILHSLWHKNVLLNKSKIVKPKVHTHIHFVNEFQNQFTFHETSCLYYLHKRRVTTVYRLRIFQTP